VANQIFPVWTYSYLALLVPVFLLTDWLRYKPVIVFQCCALFGTNALLLWFGGVGVMQAMQFVYAMVTACDVAYFSYIYSMVALQHYLKATSYCRTAQLLGYTVGSVLGQLLVSFSLLSYNNILVLTLVLISIGMVTAVLLPMPRTSMFFHQRGENGEDQGGLTEEGTDNGDTLKTGKVEADETETSKSTVLFSVAGCCSTLLQLWKDFLQCYSSREMLYWSAWWALSTCGYNQTVNYVQALWEHVEPSSNFTIYNGGVEAVSNLFGAVTAYGVGFIQLDWSCWGELALGSLSGLGAASLFAMVFSANIWICYTGYIIFKSLYMFLITIAMFQIAAGLSTERYALVFGANTFIALVLQTILTSIVVDSRGLSLDIVPQFIIYGSYFSCIALLFLLRGLYTFYLHRKSQKQETGEQQNHIIYSEQKL
ncbi:hypothetical protein NFI96_014070, partial [Prochilodus magdalenae]